MYFIGIDLGTSSVKLLLVDESGSILKSVTEEYPLYFPKPGWSEQNPSDWVKGVFSGLEKLLCGFDSGKVAAIGCGGQMHGLVVLGKDDEVIRPAILWNDGRCDKETAYLNEEIGKERLADLTANMAFAGFTAPKLLWMRKNEPENFERIRKIMLPKDYVNYVLTGVHSCDYSDAGGMLLLDVKRKAWSEEMLDICGISEEMMPELFESWEVTGTVKPEIAEKFSLSANVKVVAGAGDNAAAAIGCGIAGEGGCNISLGTSGTLFVSMGKGFSPTPNHSVHLFPHADGGYHLMGCMLSAASCTGWFTEEILKADDFMAEENAVSSDMPGRNHVFFLPYLMGERSPINDTNARGTFTGITMDVKREDMYLAVLEGVAFAIRDSFEVCRAAGVAIEKSMICGGGSRSALWKRIFANVLGIPLMTVKTEQGPGYGAAILAMTASGVFSSVEEGAKKLAEISEVILPEKELTALYEERYQKYRKIYPAMKVLFSELI